MTFRAASICLLKRLYCPEIIGMPVCCAIVTKASASKIVVANGFSISEGILFLAQSTP